MKFCAPFLVAILALASVPSGRAESPPAKNLVKGKDGWLPAPGYEWTSPDPKSMAVRWKPGLRHRENPNVIAAVREGSWTPTAGYKWVNPGFSLAVVKAGPTGEDIGRGVAKALLAWASHIGSKPRRDDTIAQSLARAFAAKLRDELLDSAIDDVFKSLNRAERDGIRHLAVVAFDGDLPANRDQVLARLRRVNPAMAGDVEATEFLIRLAQAAAAKK